MFKTEKSNDLTTQKKQDELFRMLQEATVDSIEYLTEVMDRIGEAKRAKEQALNMPRRQTSKKMIERHHNHHLVVM